MGILEQTRQRQEARRNRREARSLRQQLKAESRSYIDRLCADIWSETGDIGQAESITKTKVEADSQVYGFDPATILLLLQLALAIYKALKFMNVLAPTPEVVTAFFEGNESD
jgi:hypothetical protein